MEEQKVWNTTYHHLVVTKTCSRWLYIHTSLSSKFRLIWEFQPKLSSTLNTNPNHWAMDWFWHKTKPPSEFRYPAAVSHRKPVQRVMDHHQSPSEKSPWAIIQFGTSWKMKSHRIDPCLIYIYMFTYMKAIKNQAIHVGKYTIHHGCYGFMNPGVFRGNKQFTPWDSGHLQG